MIAIPLCRSIPGHGPGHGGSGDAKRSAWKRCDQGRWELTTAISALQAGIDTALLARQTGEPVGVARVEAPTSGHGGEEEAGISRAASLMAALLSRQDAMVETAHGLAALGASPEQSRKLYPPYPREYEEKAKGLEKLAGLRRVNESLSPAPRAETGSDSPPVDVAALKQSIQRVLADSSGRGLTARVNGVASFLHA